MNALIFLAFYNEGESQNVLSFFALADLTGEHLLCLCYFSTYHFHSMYLQCFTSSVMLRPVIP